MSLCSKNFKTISLLSFGAITIAAYVGIGMLAKPVEAMPIYADKEKQRCSTCHTQAGILDRDYKPLTGIGKYYSTYGQLPPPPKPKVKKRTAVLPVPPVRPIAATQGVTGKNVRTVTYQGGRFVLTGPRRWTEFDSNNLPSFIFDETKRDAWSVYMNDSSRNVQIQLDVYNRMIRYGKWNGLKKDLYNITSALSGSSVSKAPAPVKPLGIAQGVTGKNVGAAHHASGRFEETGRGTKVWKEYGSKGVANFTFIETRRDAWTVYLKDSSRRMDVEIDVRRKVIRNSDGRGGMKNLYKTTHFFRSR